MFGGADERQALDGIVSRAEAPARDQRYRPVGHLGEDRGAASAAAGSAERHRTRSATASSSRSALTCSNCSAGFAASVSSSARRAVIRSRTSPPPAHARVSTRSWIVETMPVLPLPLPTSSATTAGSIRSRTAR